MRKLRVKLLEMGNQMALEIFEIGDIVYLRSDSFPMSVTKLEPNDLVTVVYGKSSELRWATVPKAVLSKTKPNKWREHEPNE